MEVATRSGRGRRPSQTRVRAPGARPAGDLEAEGYVVERGLPGHDGVLLEEIAHRAVRPESGRAGRPRRCRRRASTGRHGVGERRLAATRRSDDRDEFRFLDGEGGRTTALWRGPPSGRTRCAACRDGSPAVRRRPAFRLTSMFRFPGPHRRIEVPAFASGNVHPHDAGGYFPIGRGGPGAEGRCSGMTGPAFRRRCPQEEVTRATMPQSLRGRASWRFKWLTPPPKPRAPAGNAPGFAGSVPRTG